METTDDYYYFHLIDWSDCYLYCYQSVKEVFNQQSTSNYILLLSPMIISNISMSAASQFMNFFWNRMPFRLYLRYRSMNLERLYCIMFEFAKVVMEIFIDKDDFPTLV